MVLTQTFQAKKKNQCGCKLGSLAHLVDEGSGAGDQLDVVA